MILSLLLQRNCDIIFSKKEAAEMHKDIKRFKLIRLVFAAMFAALICVATMVIQIPSPMNGYVNFGDCFILVAAWVLGSVYGFAAGGIGSAFADLFSGYIHYVPATFLIKGLTAVAAALIARWFAKKSPRLKLIGYISGAFCGELIMVIGYFGYAALIFGEGFGAWASVPGNAVQGVFGMVVGVIVIQILSSAKVLNKAERYLSDKT